MYWLLMMGWDGKAHEHTSQTQLTRQAKTNNNHKIQWVPGLDTSNSPYFCLFSFTDLGRIDGKRSRDVNVNTNSPSRTTEKLWEKEKNKNKKQTTKTNLGAGERAG